MARTAGSHSENTRPRIRQAALALFARHGFAAVSMRQIAAEVGVQVGALYNYTPDKQSLLFDLMRSHMEDLLTSVNALPEGPPDEQLKDFVSFHLRFHKDRPDAVFIAYMELRNLTPENFAAIEELRKRYESHLEQIIAKGTASSGFNVKDTKVTTLALIAMLTGVTTWFRSGGRLSMRDIEAMYWSMVARAVGLPDAL